MSFTPGPWRVVKEPHSQGEYKIFQKDSGQWLIAWIASEGHDDDEPDPDVDNARLMAHSPELLETVKDLLSSAVPNQKEHPTMWVAWERAHAIVAKVEGKP